MFSCTGMAKQGAAVPRPTAESQILDLQKGHFIKIYEFSFYTSCLLYGFWKQFTYDLNFFKTGIAISLAHDGKTRGELAYELATMDNSEEEESVKDANGAIPSEQQSEKKVSAKRNLFFVSF